MIENVSVRHWVASATAIPPGLNSPAKANPTDTELVEGPVMTKVLKSNEELYLRFFGYFNQTVVKV